MRQSMEPLILRCQHYCNPKVVVFHNRNSVFKNNQTHYNLERSTRRRKTIRLITTTTHFCSRRFSPRTAAAAGGGGVPLPPLDLTEDNVIQVMDDARVEASSFQLLVQIRRKCGNLFHLTTFESLSHVLNKYDRLIIQ